MNLFATSKDPRECAHALDDKRLGKMQLETAQLLCAGAAQWGVIYAPYKPTHMSHPVSLWVRASQHNFVWAARYGAELDTEWQYRFGRRHKSGVVCVSIQNELSSLYLNVHEPLSFMNCARNSGLGLDYTGDADVQRAYQNYLCARWLQDARMPTWTRRGPPEWS